MARSQWIRICAGLFFCTVVLHLYNDYQNNFEIIRNAEIPIRNPSTISDTKASDDEIIWDAVKTRKVNEILTENFLIRDKFQSLIDRNLNASHQDVVDFVKLILYPPSSHMIKTSMTFRMHYYQLLPPQPRWVIKYFHKMKHGFFVECGGLDGERSSNTLVLEQKYNWNGVLVEADPYYFTQMLGKNRHCWTINACLSPSGRVQWLPFEEDSGGQGAVLYGGLKAGDRVSSNRSNLAFRTHKHPVLKQIPCVPLESILLALNRKTVDYLSLDVEGMEMPILETFPHNRFIIKAMTVEYNHGSNDTDSMRNNITKMGYDYVTNIDETNLMTQNWSHDFVFLNQRWKRMLKRREEKQKAAAATLDPKVDKLEKDS